MKIAHIIVAVILAVTFHVPSATEDASGPPAQSRGESDTATTSSSPADGKESRDADAHGEVDDSDVSEVKEPPAVMEDGTYGSGTPGSYGMDEDADAPAALEPPPYEAMYPEAAAPEAASYTKVWDDWSECIDEQGKAAKCGGGKQRRGYECLSSTGSHGPRKSALPLCNPWLLLVA